MASLPQRGRIPFVGRRKELERLHEHRSRLEGNYERGRHFILIEGFSGVGKTALAEQFLAQLDHEGRSFTTRSAYSPHLRRPLLAPLCDALDELLAARFAQRRMLSLFTDSTYYPLLDRLPMLAGTIGFDSRAVGSSTDATGTLAALIASVLAHAGRFRPVVMLLDDVQWMSQEDADALSALNSALRNAPVLIVATMRREAPEAELIRTSVRPMLLDQFYLNTLPSEEMAELLTELYGARVSAQLTADVAHASEGVPMRAFELLQLLEQQQILRLDDKGTWLLGREYHPRLLAQEWTSVDKLRSLDVDERRMLLLLGCAGGQARRDELAEWSALLTGNAAEPDAMGILDRLEAVRIIKPVFANPDEVEFAHENILQAQRQLQSEEEIREVARMVATQSALRRTSQRWTNDPAMFQALLDCLADLQPQEREEIIEPMVGSTSIYAHWEKETRVRICETLLANRDRLTTREYARALIQAIAWYNLYTRFTESLPLAETLFEITATDPTCADLHAESCMFLAASRSYNDRTIDVSGLLQDAWQALGRIIDPHTRMLTELQITRTRATLIPVSRTQEGITQMRRVLQLAEQLGIDEEKNNVLPDLVMRYARMRDEETIRYFCNDLLATINNPHRGKPLPPFTTVVSSVVRAAFISGDVFTARTVFESWSRCFAPLAITDFVAYSVLTSLFAMADGEASLAADTTLNAREEVLRYRLASKQFSWELAYTYAMVQVQLLPILVAAGRLIEALGLAETMLVEMQLADNALPDVTFVLQLYRTWLRWRCLLPVYAPINLNWPSKHVQEGGRGPAVAYDPDTARQAGVAFRQLYASTVVTASQPLRFIGDLLLAHLESAERNYPEAMDAIDRAAAACEQYYDWQKELDYRSAAITVRLRWAQTDHERADEMIEAALEQMRTLFANMSEKGLGNRIGLLTALFRDEAQAIAGTTYRDAAAQIDRIGAQAQSSALAVLRNSRSQEAGPIDHARLFLMGPLRLMRPRSYMELNESVFGREVARHLLIALVAAEVLDRAPTREELAEQVAPKAKTPEQQKKALYNAASAARAACGSANSILAVGASNLELNTNLELEGSVWVDALEILRAAKNAAQLERTGKIGAAFDEYQRALILARKGEFAADTYAEWVDSARDRLREVVRQVALSAARISLRSGLYSAGIEAISTQLTRDPYDEEAHRTLIRLYNESGNRSAALKQLEKCRKLIKREFGVEPEPETLGLRREILSTATEEGAAAVRR